MNVTPLLRSFGGGEIAPELYGRLDLTKYQTGLAIARNFIILPHGPAANRPGFEYVIETKDSGKRAVLIPFTYSTTQTFVIEFGDQYVRWHTQGGTLLEAAKNITGITQPAGVVTSNAHGYSNGQWVYLSGIGGMTELNGRFAVVSDAAANTFRLKDFAGNYITTGTYGAYTAAGTVARVYEIASPFLEADLADLHFAQSADVLTITHPNYAPRELRRLGATNWQFTTPSFVPTISAPGAPTLTSSGTGGTPTKHVYVCTAVAEDALEESVASRFARSGTTRTITAATQANPGVLTTSAVHGLSVGDAICIDGVVGMTQLNNRDYYVGSVPTTSTLTLIDAATGDAVDTTAYTAYGSGGTITFCFVSLDLAVAGNYIEIDPPAVSGALRYNIYKRSNGLFGYIGQSDGSAFRDTNYVPDISQTPPELYDPFPGANNYPAAVSYFEGRRWFAGTNNKPQNLYGTRSGTESNMSYSIPTRDDDSIAIRIAAREANTIRHIVPLGDMLLLTSGGEWRITSENSDTITPSSISFRPQSYVGANNVQPVTTKVAVLYVQARGARIHEISYSWDRQGYVPNDMSVMAPHLFDFKYAITSMTFMHAPVPVLWAVRDDGVLLGMTYLPEHQINAWHQHHTDGQVESVAAVAEGVEDALYAIIKRTVNGRTVRYIERMHSRRYDALADAFFVDSGATYSGSPIATIKNGLWHLEGKIVNILADGAVHPPRIVTNGSITLEQAASTIHVGLPYEADMQTLPLTTEAAAAFGHGLRKNVNKVHMRVDRSSGIFVGPDFDKLVEVKQRSDEPYGTPPALKSEMLTVAVKPSWGSDAQICLRQSDPLPLTVLSLAPEVAVGG